MPLLYATGALPEPIDEKDYAYHLAGEAPRVRAAGWPVKVDNRDQYTAVVNQHQVPACVGCAGAGFYGMAGWPIGHNLKEYSIWAAYRWAQAHDGIKRKLKGERGGTTLHGLGAAMKKWGMLSEELWAWDPDNEGRPAPWARAAARCSRIDRYEFPEGNDQLRHAIHRYHGVLAVLRVHPGWNEPDHRNDFLIEAVEPEDENDLHCIVIAGWNDNEAYWIVRNSWGDEWANRGYAKLPYVDADQNLIRAMLPILKGA